MERRGIDVSQFQGYIDWPKVANGGTQFAIIRATYGTEGVDSRFKTNMENIRNTNIYSGAYHHSYANSTQAATQEARHFLNIIKPYYFEYPVALDIEEPTLKPLGKDAITNIVKEFCDTVQKAGYYIIIYGSLNWIQNYLNIGELSDFDIWLAQWNGKPTYSGNFGIWQYSATGDVDGISGDVDLDISYRDYPTIIRNANLNNVGSNGSNVGGNETGGDNSNHYRNYTVQEGDTLWSIAQRFLGNGNLYNQIKSLNGLTGDTIYIGQVLKIPDSTSGGTSGSNVIVKYRVKRGDTLWSIAQRFYGNGSLYNKIKEKNNLTDDVIYVGQILNIPKPESTSSQMVYIVKDGDTLWSIAQNLMGNSNYYNYIKAANGLTNNIIYAGQRLIIPSIRS
mgnify:CR=1 FL=1